MIKKNIAPIIRLQKLKQLLMKVDTDDVFESFYSAIISNIQKMCLENVWVGLFNQLQIKLLIFQSTSS